MVETSARPKTPQRVLVLHPEPFVRDSFLAALDMTDDLVCVGTAINGTAPEPDAVLCGFDWLDADATAELGRLRDLLPVASMVAVVRTAHEEHLSAAADLDVRVAPTTTPLALVLDGLRGLDPTRLDEWRDDATRRATEARLSPRELEVLRLTADGLTPDTVARRLGITNHTCRDHLKRLRTKLDCATTLQVVVTAARLGILPALGPTDVRADTDRVA
jgi:DNA-binding CsgD family transcriptional regulator